MNRYQPITPRGLHGLLFNILQAADPEAATWLHQHKPPKPFSMLAYYDLSGRLAGLRYGAITEQCATVISPAWQSTHQQGQILELGRDRKSFSCRATVAGLHLIMLRHAAAAAAG